MSTTFAGLESPCCCLSSDELSQFSCVCDDDERALRAYAAGNKNLPTMTPEQREWCLTEIGCVEGYKRSDYDGSTDQDLANGVMSAWLDYCQDKGLL